ncbi:hypothetical protein [Nocardia brasiliensis]|uniref:hypothetical protein n=1 Tax=Nocardia brasiliensis TaxID=37326 RepID=UPI002458FB52|nr:hypothetical protein [Nocardia brasiliensis]
MADDANPPENTTEDVNPTESVSADAVETVESVDGGDVQATEADNKKTEVDPEISRLNKEVDRLRKEAAANRVKGNEKAEKAAQDAAKKATEELVSKLGKQLGLIADDAEPDLAELLRAAEEQKTQFAQERDTYAEKLRDYARKDALNAAAKATDGDLDSILDSVKINREIGNLDTSADDFADQVKAIVAAAVESNPKLKKVVQASAPRSGGDLSGGNATPNRRGPKSVDDIRREKREQRERERF